MTHGAGLAHLLWIPAAALVGFTTSFALGDRQALPVDLYYLIYFAVVIVFLTAYVRLTGLDLREWLRRRLAWGLTVGLLGGLVLVQGVLAQPETAHLEGPALVGALLWCGVAYGAVDGVLLLAFPWTVVWRALGADRKGWPAKLGAAAAAWSAVLIVTTAYHLGYGDFRSPKIVQPNVGGTIALVPTLVTGNPIAAPLSHVFMHVAAVLHAPETELFLPPHR